MTSNQLLVNTLGNSTLFLDYERAFCEARGLPMALRPVDSWQLPYRCKRNENTFCAIIGRKSRACSNCLQLQARLSEAAAHQPQTLSCPNGLTESAVPVRLGEQLIGYLQTGQVFRKEPALEQFDRVARLAEEWGVEADANELREAYFGTRVIPAKQYESMVKLLALFSEHLTIVSNQLLVRQQHSEPPIISTAKQFIQDNFAEDLSLGKVARAVNTSTFYFCKMFKKCTGINFTDYVSRTRIEKAKNLLLNPHLRISEIAFEVGFQSLTHFNRVFKKIQGQSPSEYRHRLPVV